MTVTQLIMTYIDKNKAVVTLLAMHDMHVMISHNCHQMNAHRRKLRHKSGVLVATEECEPIAGPEAETPAESRGRAPGQGSGAKPRKLKAFLSFRNTN